MAQPARRLAPDRLREAKRLFDELIAQGVCRPSSSPWASPLHLVLKPDGSFRPCTDYRCLNAQTIPDKHPVSRLEDFSAFLYGKTIFSKIDLLKAFNQIPVAKEDVPKRPLSPHLVCLSSQSLCLDLKTHLKLSNVKSMRF